MIRALLLLMLLVVCSCKTTSSKSDKKIFYYVIDENAEIPDAKFADLDEAEDYVEEFKEFHTYRIIVANEN